MTKRVFFYTLLICLLQLANFQPASAQSLGLSIAPNVRLNDTTQLQVLITKDYDRLVGYALDIDGQDLIFRLRFADAPSRFAMSELRALRVLQAGLIGNDLSDGTYLQTALPGAAGGGRFRNVSLLGNLAEFDVNENLRVGIGAFIPVGLALTQRLRASISPKIHLGISNQAVWSLRRFDDEELVGDFAGLLTLGDNKLFMSLGYHFFYSTSGFSQDSRGVSLMVGGQISDQWHLYSEWLFTETRNFGDSGVLPSFSASCQLDRWRIRFGFFWGTGDVSTESPIPLVGVDYRW
ncbi:MAG: hypothetical protein AAFY36_09165 [Bacteroidota bacterium]